MEAPGHRFRSLAELTEDELDAMLAENETLFVEHKSGISSGEGYQLAKAVASFANTLGGWVLVGVTKGDPNEGLPDGWEPPDHSAFVDLVRERLENNVSPMPSFAAAIRTVRAKRVGVVRVFESADTPHILRNGAIVVREPAQDRDTQADGGRYVAGGITSHFALLELAQRGRDAREAADAKLREGALPLVQEAMDLHYDTASHEGRFVRVLTLNGPAFVLRAVALTPGTRFESWAASQSAGEACEKIALGLVRDDDEVVPTQPSVNQRGAWVRASGTVSHAASLWGQTKYRTDATAAIDAAGVLAVRVGWRLVEDEPSDRVEFTRERISTRFIRPLLAAAVEALEERELFGRYRMHLLVLAAQELFAASGAGTSPRTPPPDLPLGGELTIPATIAVEGHDESADTEPDGADHKGLVHRPGPDFDALVDRWTLEFGRSFGIELFADT